MFNQSHWHSGNWEEGTCAIRMIGSQCLGQQVYDIPTTRSLETLHTQYDKLEKVVRRRDMGVVPKVGAK